MKRYALPLAFVLNCVLPNNAQADSYDPKNHVFAGTLIEEGNGALSLAEVRDEGWAGAVGLRSVPLSNDFILAGLRTPYWYNFALEGTMDSASDFNSGNGNAKVLYGLDNLLLRTGFVHEEQNNYGLVGFRLVPSSFLPGTIGLKAYLAEAPVDLTTTPRDVKNSGSDSSGPFFNIDFLSDVETIDAAGIAGYASRGYFSLVGNISDNRLTGSTQGYLPQGSWGVLNRVWRYWDSEETGAKIMFGSKFNLTPRDAVDLDERETNVQRSGILQGFAPFDPNFGGRNSVFLTLGGVYNEQTELLNAAIMGHDVLGDNQFFGLGVSYTEAKECPPKVGLILDEAGNFKWFSQRITLGLDFDPNGLRSPEIKAVLWFGTETPLN